MIYVLLVLCTIFGIARFFVPTSGLRKQDIFKDFAHILVGILIGLAIFDPIYWWIFAAFTAVEVIAFLGRKNGTVR